MLWFLHKCAKFDSDSDTDTNGLQEVYKVKFEEMSQNIEWGTWKQKNSTPKFINLVQGKVYEVVCYCTLWVFI